MLYYWIKRFLMFRKVMAPSSFEVPLWLLNPWQWKCPVTQHYIPEDLNSQPHHCANLTSLLQCCFSNVVVNLWHSIFVLQGFGFRLWPWDWLSGLRSFVVFPVYPGWQEWGYCMRPQPLPSIVFPVGYLLVVLPRDLILCEVLWIIA
jgi:hypothetical protein